VGGVDSVVLHDLIARRRGGGEQRAVAVDKRDEAALDGVADVVQRPREEHVPGAEVDVVHHPDLGEPGPQRRKERHPVEDLDDPVGRTETSQPLVEHGGGEHAQPAAAPHDPHAVADDLGWRAVHPSGVVDDLAAGRREVAGDLVGVGLGPAGVGIVEVAEGEQVDPAEARLVRQGRHLVVDGGGGGGGHDGGGRRAASVVAGPRPAL
jgi:hypothetical protein